MMINGSLKEYPISLLLEIFQYRSETGLLEISSTSNSGQFYFKDGKLVDAVLNNAAGMEALRCAEGLTDGSFEFNPVAPAEYARLVWQNSLRREQLTDRPNWLRSIFHFRVRELLANAAISSFTLGRTLTSMAQALLVRASINLEGKKQAVRTIVAALEKRITDWFHNLRSWMIETLSTFTANLKHQISFSLSRAKGQLPSLVNQLNLRVSALALIAMAVLGATLIIKGRWVDPLTGRDQTSDPARTIAKMGTGWTTDSERRMDQKAGAPGKPQASHSRSTKKTVNQTNDTIAQKANSNKSPKGASGLKNTPLSPAINSTGTSAKAEQTISVLVRIEDGHVSDASVLEPRPELERYEAAALRIARQRRYAAATKPFDIVTLKIKKP